MESPIVPLGDRVVVRKEDVGEAVQGGIVLPPSSGSSDQSIGTVIAVGEGRKMETGEYAPLGVKENQKIIFSWGEKVNIKGIDYHIVSESNILGILK